MGSLTMLRILWIKISNTNSCLLQKNYQKFQVFFLVDLETSPATSQKNAEKNDFLQVEAVFWFNFRNQNSGWKPAVTRPPLKVVFVCAILGLSVSVSFMSGISRVFRVFRLGDFGNIGRWMILKSRRTKTS